MAFLEILTQSSDFIRTIFIFMAFAYLNHPLTLKIVQDFFLITDIWITPRVKYTDLFL